MSTEFRKLLFEVSEALVTDELSALKFLSLDYVAKGTLETIHEPKAFFEVLQERDMIEAGNLFFLKELLYRIRRIDLLSAHLGSSREEMERELRVPGRAQVSDYRQLLYEIAEDLTSENVQKVKFLLRGPLLKSKLQENASMLQVFLEMEINGIIEEDNLTMLKDIFQGFRADLKKKIDAYEEKKREKYSREEVRYPVSVSVYPEEQGAEGEAAKQYGKIYKMKNNPHGYCLIINNHIFKNPHHNREGTLQDGEAVKKVFKWLQFETVEYMDLEGKKIYDTVEEYSKKDHRNMDCFVCFIFSHGEKDKIKVESDSSGHLEVDARPSTSIPDRADFLIGMATVEDYLCYRSRNTGSVYIQSLCENMKSLCPQRVDLATILTKVNHEVATKDINGFKQMPKITSTLLKLLIFEVPQ
ncbi:caspase-8-like isoform X2 [Ammospiza nelsoni]|uniref:caspase-8-like isoform X2 n=1 Tax=Ammospiza nelsoni TaxID=2857394 RepID=UPI00286CA8BF|nr:caspase-8-like isoform X2 [Ammospiza nelsoni]